MKVYCYGCGTSEDTDFLVRCPKCETMDIGIEPDRGWHALCRLFAQSKGWEGSGGTVSIPLWFEKEPPERLEEWKAFKAKLTDVESLPLPTHLKGKYWESFEYWINTSGILPLQQGTMNDLIITPPIGSLVHKLATAYADHHRQREEAEQKAHGEAEEKLKSKGRKKTLIQRVRRMGKRP